MKRSWIVRKDEKAVSPVIATILMVAITVVLAAVLYVMVTGLIGGGGTGQPTVAFGNPTETTTPGTFTLSPSGISGGCSPNCPLSAFKVQMFNATTTLTPMCASPPVVANTANPPWLCTVGGVNIGFTDSNTNAKMDTLDFFVIKGVAASTSYKVSLIWATTGGEVTSGSISK